MRILTALAAGLFLYLALIPAGLVYSTLDSACAGLGCETSVASRVFFVALYALCLIAVLGTATLFAHHSATGALETQQRLPRALGATAAVIGVTLFVLFLVAFPLGGTVALLISGASYLGMRLQRRREGPGPPDSGAAARTNGHSPDGLRLG